MTDPPRLIDQTIVVTLPAVPTDPRVPRNVVRAIRAQRAATIDGTCPLCGAASRYAGADHREDHHLIIDHDAWCPAGDDQLRPHIRKWERRGVRFRSETYVLPPTPVPDGVQRGTFEDIRTGYADPDALIVLDFVAMGRTPPHARDGLVEAVGRVRARTTTPHMMVTLPGGGPIGTEAELAHVTPRWSTDHPAAPGECDLCGAHVDSDGWVAAVIPGPTVDGVTFEEIVAACRACTDRPIADLRPDRVRLITAGVVAAPPWGMPTT